jgi:hypothetical protein
MADTKIKKGQKRGRKPGVPNKMTQDIKRAIDYAFTQINHDNKWLIDMATNGDPADKKLFVQLLARTIPASLSVQVSHTFDLAAAIVAADARLKLTGDNPNSATPLLSDKGNIIEVAIENDAKSLITNNT